MRLKEEAWQIGGCLGQKEGGMDQLEQVNGSIQGLIASGMENTKESEEITVDSSSCVTDKNMKKNVALMEQSMEMAHDDAIMANKEATNGTLEKDGGPGKVRKVNPMRQAKNVGFDKEMAKNINKDSSQRAEMEGMARRVSS
ncbi:hypothetical protein SUGI_1169050 [Cryptomeria japonica]|nr:hypothetical protein SUGI_1169050 [Cryptomeria japonica]